MTQTSGARSVKRVLVVGAGIAGLQATRRLVEIGLNVLCLEATGSIGGVWSKNYAGYALQVPRDLYVFPDFPYPPHLRPKNKYPTGQEVQLYVQAYADHFNLHDYIRLNSKLVHLKQLPSGAWDVLYLDVMNDKFYQVRTDYAVVATGIYSQPYVPSYENAAAYTGLQIHARDFQDVTLANDRSVVIVGAGKTALDCVAEVSAMRGARSVTMLFRQAHWPVPRMVGNLSVRHFMFNRTVSAMLAPYYDSSSTSHVTHSVMKPIKKLFWRTMQRIIKRQFDLRGDMVPPVTLPEDLFYGGQILDNNFERNLRTADNVRMLRGEVHSFTQNGVFLQDGSFVRADLIIYCTGYHKSYDYLPGEMRAKLELQKDGLYLYRSIIPPCITNLAFVGSEVSTYNNILTAGLQSLWLANLLAGKIQLPPVQVMQADVREQQRWKREVMPAQRHRGSVVMLYMQDYHDQLLRDLKINTHRKGFNKIKEVLQTYTAEDYAPLFHRFNLKVPHPIRPEARRPAVQYQSPNNSGSLQSAPIRARTVAEAEALGVPTQPRLPRHLRTASLSPRSSGTHSEPGSSGTSDMGAAKGLDPAVTSTNATTPTSPDSSHIVIELEPVRSGRPPGRSTSYNLEAPAEQAAVQPRTRRSEAGASLVELPRGDSGRRTAHRPSRLRLQSSVHSRMDLLTSGQASLSQPLSPVEPFPEDAPPAPMPQHTSPRHPSKHSAAAATVSPNAPSSNTPSLPSSSLPTNNAYAASTTDWLSSISVNNLYDRDSTSVSSRSVMDAFSSAAGGRNHLDVASGHASSITIRPLSRGHSLTMSVEEFVSGSLGGHGKGSIRTVGDGGSGSRVAAFRTGATLQLTSVGARANYMTQSEGGCGGGAVGGSHNAPAPLPLAPQPSSMPPRCNDGTPGASSPSPSSPTSPQRTHQGGYGHEQQVFAAGRSAHREGLYADEQQEPLLLPPLPSSASKRSGATAASLQLSVNMEEAEAAPFTGSEPQDSPVAAELGACLASIPNIILASDVLSDTSDTKVGTALGSNTDTGSLSLALHSVHDTFSRSDSITLAVHSGVRGVGSRRDIGRELGLAAERGQGRSSHQVSSPMLTFASPPTSGVATPMLETGVGVSAAQVPQFLDMNGAVGSEAGGDAMHSPCAPPLRPPQGAGHVPTATTTPQRLGSWPESEQS